MTESCLLTDPGALLSASDEPRGAIKIVIGLVIALVLAYSVRRLRSRQAELSGRELETRPVSFDRVLVVGAGQMGAGIAQVVAASGREVLLHDALPGAVERGLETIARSLGKLHEKERPGSRDCAPAHHPRRVGHGRRPDDRGDRRGPRCEEGALPLGRRGPSGRGGARLEHVLDPHHRARGRGRRRPERA